jgi:hypothetical protein
VFHDEEEVPLEEKEVAETVNDEVKENAARRLARTRQRI